MVYAKCVIFTNDAGQPEHKLFKIIRDLHIGIQREWMDDGKKFGVLYSFWRFGSFDHGGNSRQVSRLDVLSINIVSHVSSSRQTTNYMRIKVDDDNVMMHLIIFGITFVTTMKSLFDSGECRDIALCRVLK